MFTTLDNEMLSWNVKYAWFSTGPLRLDSVKGSQYVKICLGPYVTAMTWPSCDGTNDRYVNGWMDGWMDEWMDRWINGWTDGWRNGWMEEWMDGWMNGWTDGWMNGQMDGWMNIPILYIYKDRES